jgi:hypothetical protein
MYKFKTVCGYGKDLRKRSADIRTASGDGIREMLRLRKKIVVRKTALRPRPKGGKRIVDIRKAYGEGYNRGEAVATKTLEEDIKHGLRRREHEGEDV